MRRLQLLSAAQTDAVSAIVPLFPEPRALARELLQRGWLTAYQVNQVLQGRAAELIVGPHVLLERLGEGGTGQVFKARHKHMDRVVAVKLIRKELLTDAEVVGRFQREVRVISQLTHPNVVAAYDAGPIGSGYFLAMEVVEGTDLMRRVKQEGPLPLNAACSLVRQAALGLQHIHERGLVHRDIKPSNLMVTEASGIKILDLGLARLQRPIDEAGAALTANGAVLVGTLDYMAPEQALNFHDVDHRADLYSLGATFYFLLTGQPPFPGGTMAQKLLRQQQATPTPLEQLRADVPPAVALVVRRMLARYPEDRVATAAEVVAALTPTIAPLALLAPVDAGQAAPLALPHAIPVQPTGLDAWPRRLPARLRLLAGRRRAAVAALLLMLLGIALWWQFGPDGVREKYLSDMQETDVVVAKGTNFGKQGKTLADGGVRHVTVAGVPSPKGLYMEPPNNGAGHVSYRLGKKYRRFEAAVGLNDSVSYGHLQASFTVVGDGKTLWSSDKMPNNKTQKCVVDVSDVDVLELFATGNGHPVWLEPKVTR